MGEGGGGEESEGKGTHGYWMTWTAPRPTKDSTCSMKATSAATVRWGSRSTANWSGSSRRSMSLPVPGAERKRVSSLARSCGVGVVEGDADAEGVGEFDLYVFEGDDAGDGELGGGVFFAAQDAAD